MSAHTPGPWIARQDPDGMLGEDWMIGRPSGKPDEVAVCSKKDAALLAAAPDLLAAARSGLGSMQREREALAKAHTIKATGKFDSPEAQCAIEGLDWFIRQAEQAIAKAVKP